MLPAPLTQVRLLQELEHWRAASPAAPAAERVARTPRLVEEAELLGRFDSAGLRDPPFLIRLPTGRLVAVSDLLQLVIAGIDGTRDTQQIAELVSAQYGLQLTAADVEYVLERKLGPLGLLAGPSPASHRPPDPMLALRFRIAVIPARAVCAIGALFAPLFAPVIVVLVLAGLVALDCWLVVSHAVDRELLLSILAQPALLLALTAIGWLSVAFHECGHAAAGRYGGMRPGRMGVGLYFIWPVFYTDVSHAYRLPRGGRLRIDLGGVYFNAVFALVLAGVYAATGFGPLLLAIIAQHILILTQFVPWLRLDGYWIVSDLIGVLDLSARIKPTLQSLLWPAANVDELKPWARAAVSVWVTTTVAALGAMLGALIYTLPRLLPLLYEAFLLQIDLLGVALERGELLVALGAVVGATMLALPVAGLALTALLSIYGMARWIGRAMFGTLADPPEAAVAAQRQAA